MRLPEAQFDSLVALNKIGLNRHVAAHCAATIAARISESSTAVQALYELLGHSTATVTVLSEPGGPDASA